MQGLETDFEALAKVLQEEREELRRLLENSVTVIDKLSQQNAALRSYAKHHADCVPLDEDHNDAQSACSCGLEALSGGEVQEGEDEPSALPPRDPDAT